MAVNKDSSIFPLSKLLIEPPKNPFKTDCISFSDTGNYSIALFDNYNSYSIPGAKSKASLLRIVKI